MPVFVSRSRSYEPSSFKEHLRSQTLCRLGFDPSPLHKRSHFPSCRSSSSRQGGAAWGRDSVSTKERYWLTVNSSLIHLIPPSDWEKHCQKCGRSLLSCGTPCTSWTWRPRSKTTISKAKQHLRSWSLILAKPSVDRFFRWWICERKNSAGDITTYDHYQHSAELIFIV